MTEFFVILSNPQGCEGSQNPTRDESRRYNYLLLRKRGQAGLIRIDTRFKIQDKYKLIPDTRYMIQDAGNTNKIVTNELPKLHDNCHILTFCA